MIISKKYGRFQREPAILRVADSLWNPTEKSPYLNKCVNTVLTPNFELFRNIQVRFTRMNPFYAQICFHFQQAAEKYLKAVIVADDLEFQKIHDLVTLLKSCLGRRPELIRLMPDCTLLNRFYIDTRYPVHWPTDYTKDKAFLSQAAAEAIRDTVKACLK